MLKMVLVFLFSSVAFCGNIWAGVNPLQGDYALSERIKLSSLKHYEKVEGLTPRGSQRMQLLKSQGYSCRQKTALIWSCSKILPTGELSAELVSQMQAKWSGFLISFRQPTSPATQVQQDDDIEVWSVAQKVFVRTSVAAEPKSWDQVSYFHIYSAAEITNLVVLGDYRATESPSLKRVDEETLVVQDVVDVVSGASTLRYFIDLYISRIQ